MKNLILFVGILFSSLCFSQTVYYKMSGGKIVDEEYMSKFRNRLAENGEFKETVLETITKNDSIIKVVDFEYLDKMSPYKPQIKKIGKTFSKNLFTDINNKKINLKGKPTVINFWYTQCPPCVKEIPLLNKLKAKYKNVNFVAITFDDAQKTKDFIKKKPFNFKLVQDGKLIGEEKIVAYPMTMVLDKNAKIIDVQGEIESTEKIEKILSELSK